MTCARGIDGKRAMRRRDERAAFAQMIVDACGEPERARVIDAVREPTGSEPPELADQAAKLGPAVKEIIAALDEIGAFATLHPQ